MISSEVQRTLVKSPPELWAELSDPDALARHLGELGEIRITRTEPEKTVEWEAADTTGKVLLKSSGWGTKVTLTAARELPAPEPAAAPVIVDEPEAIVEEPIAVEEAEPEPDTIAEELHRSELRPGFFARVFRRRHRRGQSSPPAQEAIEREIEQIEPEQPEAIEIIEPAQLPGDDTTHEDMQAAGTEDIAAELKTAEEAAEAEVTAVLTAALDRLGAAHHRPFSRA
jgi:hypothetical protein